MRTNRAGAANCRRLASGPTTSPTSKSPYRATSCISSTTSPAKVQPSDSRTKRPLWPAWWFIVLYLRIYQVQLARAAFKCMDLKKQQLTTVSSTVFSQISPFEATVMLTDPMEKTVKLYFEKRINCPSQKHASFITKLLNSLSVSKGFEGTAALEQPEQIPNPSKMQYFNEEESLRHSAALLSRHRISYTFVCHFSCLPKQPLVFSDLQEIRKKCEFVHQRIEEFCKRYRIQNRMNYWLYQLGEALLEYERGEAGGTQVREGINQEEVLDSD